MIDRIRSAPLLAVALFFPISLLGDTSGTVTLNPKTELNVSTGAIGSSGGDILWTGTQLNFDNGAKGYLIFGSGPLDFSLGLSDVQSYVNDLSSAPIPGISLSIYSVLLFETGGGVFGKAMVINQVADSAGSTPLTILFDSFGTGNPNAPTVDQVLNAGSYGQAVGQGGVFVVKGTNLSPSGFTSTSYPLPTLSNGVSITFTPLFGGAAIQAYIVYLYNQNGVNQLAGIVPSTASGYYVVREHPQRYKLARNRECDSP